MVKLPNVMRADLLEDDRNVALHGKRLRNELKRGVQNAHVDRHAEMMKDNRFLYREAPAPGDFERRYGKKHLGKMHRHGSNLELSTERAWKNMIMRCYYPQHPSYAEYGGRGIRVAKEWLPPGLKLSHLNAAFVFKRVVDTRYQASYEAFLYTVGVKPSARHSLDRIDANGHYTPTNVRWATPEEQGVNKRNPAKMVLHPQTGEPILATHLAKELKLVYQVMRARMIKAGTWDAYERQQQQSKESV